MIPVIGWPLVFVLRILCFVVPASVWR